MVALGFSNGGFLISSIIKLVQIGVKKE